MKNYDTIVIAVDPATKNVGMAIATADSVESTVKIYKSLLIQSKQATWEARSEAIVNQIVENTPPHHSNHGTPVTIKAIIEMPAMYFSEKGEAAANSGSLVKLAFVTGMIYNAFLTNDIYTMLVPAMSWKGNVPKNITLDRIIRHWNIAPDDNNEADAVGIIDWYFRKYLRKQGVNYEIIKNSASKKPVMYVPSHTQKFMGDKAKLTSKAKWQQLRNEARILPPKPPVI